MNKKAHLLAFILLCTISCTTVPRPDMGAVTNNGKKYEYVQQKVLGVIPLNPKLVPVVTKADKAQEVIQKPAKWLLWVALPLSILAAVGGGVAVVWLQNARMAKACLLLSVSLFAASLLAVAWLLATAIMWLFITVMVVLVSMAIYGLYRVTKGTSPRKLKELLNSISSSR